MECYTENPKGALFCKKCGCFFKASDKQEEKNLLKERYKILSLLSTGGVGGISLTYDMSLNKLCAVKGIHKKGLSALSDKERDDVVKPFKREAELLATLRHTNLPCMTDYFIEGDYCYLVMDYIEGKDLEVILDENEGKGLPEKQVIEWAIQVSRVIEYLHSQKPPVIHGDVKPANLIVREFDGCIMLVDFGTAFLADLEGGDGPSYGTDGYAPPEQYEGILDIRSDIYAFGATLYELLTGILPEELFEFSPLRDITPEISPDTEYLVMKCLEYEMKDRFSNAKVLKQNLLEIYQKNFAIDENEYKTRSFIKPLVSEATAGDINVLVVDDETQICDAFNDMAKFFKGIHVMGFANNGEEAIKKVVEGDKKPDVILMDLRMPGIDGIETTKEILKISPVTKIVVVTAYLKEEEFFACFEAGVSGYILKSDTYWGELEKSIKKAFAGGIPISADASHLLVRAWSFQKKSSPVPVIEYREGVKKEVKEEKKFCPACNRINRPSAKFCEACGTTLSVAGRDKKVVIKLPEEPQVKSMDKIEISIRQLKVARQEDRLDILKSLSNIQDKRLVLPLIDMLKDSEPLIRKEVISILEKQRDARAFKPLVDRLTDNDLSVRIAVLNTLGNVKYKEGFSYLLEALKDENHQIRKQAVISLGDFGDERAVEPLKEARRKESPFSINMKMVIDKSIQKIKGEKDKIPTLTGDADEVEMSCITRVFTPLKTEIIPVSDVYNEEGEKYYKENNDALALENFNKALEVDPNYGKAHLNIARVILRQFNHNPELKNEYRINEALLHLNECLAVTTDTGLVFEARKYIETLIEEWNDIKAGRVKVKYNTSKLKKLPEEEKIEEEVEEEVIEEEEVEEEVIEEEEELEEEVIEEEVIEEEEEVEEEVIEEEVIEEEDKIYSIQELKEKLKEKPDDLLLLWKLGEACYKSGDFDTSLSSYLNILRIDPSDIKVHFHIGLVYKEQQKIFKALLHLKKYLKVSHQGEYATDAEKYIKELE